MRIIIELSADDRVFILWGPRDGHNTKIEYRQRTLETACESPSQAVRCALLWVVGEKGGAA